MLTANGARSRRDFLATTVLGAACTAIMPAWALATPDQVAADIAKLFGDRQPKEGRIALDLPSIAENGLVVPLNFSVESPMTEQDYVKTVHFYAEGNPNPLVAVYHFTPLAPKAAAQIRIRLAQTQNVVAYAEMSNGDVYMAKKEVKVTIGGCGG